jgi:hypothetical protein
LAWRLSKIARSIIFPSADFLCWEVGDILGIDGRAAVLIETYVKKIEMFVGPSCA